MQLTKYEHSALDLHEGDDRLIIDPGNLTTPITDASHVVAIVVTHQHPDHVVPEQVFRILERAPDARIFGAPGVADVLPDYQVTTVQPGDEHEVGGFRLRWAGGEHAIIHDSIPRIANCGVLVNDVLYHPGDSLWVPDFDVPVLGVPIGAPWLKIAEVMDWLLEVKPPRAFGIHEMGLSVAGRALVSPRAQWAVEQGGGEYFDLQPLDLLDL